MIYIIGSLANPVVLDVTKRLREAGCEVFSEWYASGEGADERWQTYFKSLGLTYREILNTDFVNNAFAFDLEHLQKADVGVLVMNAGRSGHLELGWLLGHNKRGYIYFPDGEPERPDLMAKLATGILFSMEELLEVLKQ